MVIHDVQAYQKGLKVDSYIGFKKSKITDKIIEDLPKLAEKYSRNNGFSGDYYKNIKYTMEDLLPGSMVNISPFAKEIPLTLVKEENIIMPKNSVGFKGKIYIVTDDSTASSTDKFLHFAKSSGFATLVGSSGHGIGIGQPSE